MNTASEVDPCPGKGCVYSGVEGQEAVFIVWNGGAFAPDYSPYGALVCHGGGHNAYSGNEVYVFDLTTRRWSRVGAPSTYAESQANGDGEYPDGQPFPPHTYAGVAYLPASLGGGPKGSFLRFGFAGTPVTQWVHRMPLDASATTPRAWSRFANLSSALSGSYWAVAFDPTRARFWVISNLNSWARGFGYVSANGTVTVLPNQGDNVDGDHALGYCPRYDMLVHLATAGGASHLAGRLCNGAGAFVKLRTTGPFPSPASGLEWSTAGGYFVAYPGNGSSTVYKLSPPSSDPLNGTWTWTTQTLTGVQGATPVKASGYASGQWNGQWSRFREVPALSSPGRPVFVYADGRNQPVQLWAL
ncbi:MAG: hypothetical protein N2688_09200 [Burkholderiaceae bacterium]|nr:hypothetical protein [Burkholderiaceae bacterium]